VAQVGNLRYPDSFADFAQTRIAIEPLDRIVAHVAITAMNLERPPGDRLAISDWYYDRLGAPRKAWMSARMNTYFDDVCGNASQAKRSRGRKLIGRSSDCAWQ
jgi:hypothetical protein